MTNRKQLVRLLGWYYLAAAALGGMVAAALKLAEPAPCADCAEKAAVVDAQPPASPAAGDPTAAPCRTCDGYGSIHRLSCPQASAAGE